jgi:hypothetical protein
VKDQPGCKVLKFFNYDPKIGHPSVEIYGPGTIDVTVKVNDPEWTKYLYVYCKTTP